MPKSPSPFLKPLLIALVLFGLPVAAQYRPSFSSVREVTSIHVNKDGSSVTLTEVQRKIETQQGIEMLGEQRISYNSTLENVEVLEAYTILADGTRVNVEPDKIRTQDDVDADGSNIYSDSKVKLIIFPKVEVGASLGNSNCQTALGTAYMAGDLIEQDFEKAHNLFHLAHIQGDPWARMCWLSRMKTDTA